MPALVLDKIAYFASDTRDSINGLYRQLASGAYSLRKSFYEHSVGVAILESVVYALYLVLSVALVLLAVFTKVTATLPTQWSETQ